MKHYLSTLLLALLSLCTSAHTITVLQWNIWQVDGGYDAIVDEIVRLRPDFVMLSEVRNYHGTRFCDRITESLRQRGEEYWSFYSYDTGCSPVTPSPAASRSSLAPMIMAVSTGFVLSWGITSPQARVLGNN